MAEYEKVIQDCDSALKIFCNEALYRRCQALEALERFEEAYLNAEFIISFDPNNKVIQPVVARLYKIIQERRNNKNTSVNAKITQMLDVAFDVSEDNEKRETAMNTLQVLTCERAGAEVIFKKENLSKITQLVKVEREEKIICSAIRIVGKLCKNNFSQTESITKEVLPWCLEMIKSTSTERVNTTTYCLQNILRTYSGINNKFNSKFVEELCKAHEKEIDTILPCLLNSITSKSTTGLARDAIIEIITRNINYTTLDWAKRLVEFGGVQILLEVASQMEEYKYEFSLDITSSTQSIIGVCLGKIYENTYYYDDHKKKFIDTIDDFIADKFLKSDTESNVRIVLAIKTLIFGPLDVAYAIIMNDKIIKMIVDMSETDDILQKKVVCECIIAAGTKYYRKTAFINKSAKIFENLRQSKDDSIRVRALVGLCKFNYKIDLIADGATNKRLAEICRRCLINPEKEENTRKWAVEGLSYLTFDTQVKNELIKNRQAVKAMIKFAETNDQTVLYAVVRTLVNLCDAYDDEELTPEMTELAKFVGHYSPGKDLEDLKDDDDFVKERRCALARASVTGALVSLAKTDNQNCKELIARVFNAICSQEEVREMVVQQGGTKALLLLALDGTDKGKKHASRALVRLGLTIHPDIAFPGQTITEVVRPITNLLNFSENLNTSVSVEEHCEVLIALFKLAVNDSMRKLIFFEIGFDKFVDYIYADNIILNRTTAHLLYNTTLCREVALQCTKHINYASHVDLYSVFLCKHKDEDTMKSLARTLAMLTAVSRETCEETLNEFEFYDPSLEFLHFLITNPNDDLQHSGIKIILNMMCVCVREARKRDVAAKLMQTDIMGLLKALSNNDNVKIETKELASLALDAAAEWDKIHKNVEGNDSS